MNPDSSPLCFCPRPTAALLGLAARHMPLPSPPATSTGQLVGDFLHATLRPVLKLQNDLLLAVVADFVLDHHMPLAKASSTDQQRLLAELLGRNTKLRYTVMGLITGLFHRRKNMPSTGSTAPS